MSGTARSGLGPSSGDINSGVLHSAGNSSGPSVGASSLVTDANSALSGGPRLQRSASINTESYMRLPASPMSFSSNNISASSVMDGSSIVQQSSHQDQMQKQGASSVTSQPTGQDPGNLLHVHKKPRIDMRQEDVLQQHGIQQLLQRQDSMQLQGHRSPQLQALLYQQRQRQQQQQQQQMLQSVPLVKRAQVQQQQQQMRQQLQQHAMQPMIPVKRPYDNGLCHRRLMQYIYHQRHRPSDNSILYWRKFVVEYFSPCAKKRWCFSKYDSVGNNALGAFPRAATDAWHCDICGSKSGKTFDATFEILPRLSQIKFDRGAIDELLFLDMPHETRLASGAMVLEYMKAVQETVYEQLRVVREGQLRIIFTPELKILSWEFCARCHEEFFPRRLVAPQINHLLQVAQKYQTAVNERGSAGVPPQDLQSTCNMFVTAGRQMARSLELQTLNDLGFSKRYVRCLQIFEVVNSMKDLIDFSKEHKMGPIDSLKNYPRHVAARFQNQKMQEMDQNATAQCLPADQATLNKMFGVHPGLSNHMNNYQTGNCVMNNTAQNAAALNSYQSLLRSSLSPTHGALPPEGSCSFNVANQGQEVPYQGSMPSIYANTSMSNLLGANQQQITFSGGLPQQSNIQPSQMNQNLPQHVIRQMLQDMMSNNRVVPQQLLNAPNVIGNVGAEGITGAGSLATRMVAGSIRNGLALANGTSNMANHTTGQAPTRSNSFKSVATNSIASGSSFNLRQDTPQNNLHLPELDQDISQELVESGMFSGEPVEMGY